MMKSLRLLCLIGLAPTLLAAQTAGPDLPNPDQTSPALHGSELKISANALERTLDARLFKSPDAAEPGNSVSADSAPGSDALPGRYYIRGNAEKPCSVYAEAPHIVFKSARGPDDARIWVHIKIHARQGKAVAGTCLGLILNTESDVSFIPFADGETVGFRDARIERVSSSGELNFLIEPFLKHKIPANLEVNAADLIRKTLAGSEQRAGYAITLDRLQIGSLEIRDDLLVVDVDADVTMQ